MATLSFSGCWGIELGFAGVLSKHCHHGAISKPWVLMLRLVLFCRWHGLIQGVSKDSVKTAERLFNSAARSKQSKHADLKIENENPAPLRVLALLSGKEADQTARSTRGSGNNEKSPGNEVKMKDLCTKPQQDGMETLKE